MRNALTRVALALGILLLLSTVPSQAADRPNILWLTAEDMSPTLGCYGDEYAHTPHLDRLAAESVRYTNAFATAPVCSPARSCLITGCYATTLGTQRLRSAFPIPETMRGFPALMREAGYFCTNNEKTDYNTANAAKVIAASWDASSADAHWRHNRLPGKPFFSVFNDMISHQSRTMVWPYEQFRGEVQSQLAPGEIHDPETAPVPPYYPDTPLVRKTVARYYDCVTAMDKRVGRRLKQLEEDGLSDDTIVFFYSDHGSGMPRHKRVLLDSGMHVPLLVRFPEKYRHLAPAAPGESVGRLVSFVDFAPTVLSLCGLTVPAFMQGTPFLGPDAGTPADYVFGARDRVDEVFDVARSVRDKQFLYIRNFMPHTSYHPPSAWPDQGAVRREMTRFARQHREDLTGPQRHYFGPNRAREELYDVQADPRNLRNLADQPKHGETLNRMREALVRWMLKTHDLGFLPESDAWERAAGTTPFQMARQKDKYPLARIVRAASLVGDPTVALRRLTQGLSNGDPAIRYWSAVGLSARGRDGEDARSALQRSLSDEAPAVRIEAANALLRLGDSPQALRVLIDQLDHDQPSVVLHAARTIELLGTAARAAEPAMRQALERAQDNGEIDMFVRFSAEAFLKELQN